MNRFLNGLTKGDSLKKIDNEAFRQICLYAVNKWLCLDQDDIDGLEVMGIAHDICKNYQQYDDKIVDDLYKRIIFFFQIIGSAKVNDFFIENGLDDKSTRLEIIVKSIPSYKFEYVGDIYDNFIKHLKSTMNTQGFQS